MKSENDRISSLLKKANHARSENRLKDARHTLHTALEIVEEIRETTCLFQVMNDLARIERDLEETESSIANYMKLAELSEKQENKMGVAHAYRHLGDIYREHGDLKKAENYYKKALEIYLHGEKNSSLSLANTYRGYALLKFRANKKEDSLNLWKNAKTIYEQFHIHEGIEECNGWIEKLKQ